MWESQAEYDAHYREFVAGEGGIDAWMQRIARDQTRHGRRVAVPSLPKDAVATQVDAALEAVDAIADRASAFEWIEELPFRPYGMFDAEPAKGFERFVRSIPSVPRLTVENPDVPIAVTAVEDRRGNERHIALVGGPAHVGGTLWYEKTLKTYVADLVMEGLSYRGSLLERLGMRVGGPRVFVYVYVAPTNANQSHHFVQYRVLWTRDGFELDERECSCAQPRALVEAAIANDEPVSEVLKQRSEPCELATRRPPLGRFTRTSELALANMRDVLDLDGIQTWSG